MAFTTSKVFAAFLLNALTDTGEYNMDTATEFKCALYAGTITPDETCSLANTAYGAGQWATSIVDTGTSAPAGWPAVGRPLSLATPMTQASNVVKFDSDDTASANATTTLASNSGCLIYNDTMTGDYGVAFLYFGGPQSVTVGSYTVVYASGGIFTLTV